MFSTPPFAEGATIAGPISATIFASSSNTNLELIAALYDMAPDGFEQPISMGAVLGSQSRLDTERSWMDEDGTVT
ncbi:MAG TPA: CocE/NonD family hydrolase C-terminal non-catalytic domain-containing protein [Pseudaminobacter sp.]|nr:CocE/NonD family hydrolase C-terminal non-catalytic domain-containing protein [Pseudaminobacter sp.]